MLLSTVCVVCLQLYAIKNGLEIWKESGRNMTGIAGLRFELLPGYTGFVPGRYANNVIGSTFAKGAQISGTWRFMAWCCMTLFSQGHPNLPLFKHVGPGSGPLDVVGFSRKSCWRDPGFAYETPRRSSPSLWRISRWQSACTVCSATAQLLARKWIGDQTLRWKVRRNDGSGA